MSMCLAMCTLSDTNIGKVLESPTLIWKVIGVGDATADTEGQSAPFSFAKLLGRKPKSATPPPPALNLVEGEIVEEDLDKAWHGIHYLLTHNAAGGEGPLNFLLSGGREVGDVDIGYGPARALTSEQVLAVHAALQPIDSAYLKSRFNAPEMTALEIYPAIWDRDPEDDTFGYCDQYFGALKDFVDRAVQRKVGLIIYLS